MNRRYFALSAAAVWLTPALLAGIIGWPGVWGTGSAFGDLLLPLPISGGLYRLPSFVLAILVLRAYPRLPSNMQAMVRAACLAAALCGAFMLLDLERLRLALHTDYSGDALRLRRSYGGLSLLADGVWCFAFGLARAPLAAAWPATVGAILAPVAWLWLQVGTVPGFPEAGPAKPVVDFRQGMARPAGTRGDQAFYVYTGHDPASPAFRMRAETFASRYSPAENVNAEDVALHFTTSLDAALTGREPPVAATLCLYEDGTPSAWLDGDGDCFTGHENRQERLQELMANLPDDLSAPVRRYLVWRSLCEGAELPDRYDSGLAVVRQCFNTDLGALRSAAADEVGETEVDLLFATLQEAL